MQPGSSLTLSGLTFVADFGESTAIAPIIQAEGSITLDHCAFEAKGHAPGTRAVVAGGKGTVVDGCWFQGFDRALAVISYPGSRVGLSHCMVSWTKADGRPTGYALRLETRSAPSARGNRLLSIDHCTVDGGGLLEVGQLSTANPVTAEVKDNAVRSGPSALL